MSPFSFVADGMASQQLAVRVIVKSTFEAMTALTMRVRRRGGVCHASSSLAMVNRSLSGPMNPVLRDDRDPFQWRPKLWHNA